MKTNLRNFPVKYERPNCSYAETYTYNGMDVDKWKEDFEQELRGGIKRAEATKANSTVGAVRDIAIAFIVVAKEILGEDLP